MSAPLPYVNLEKYDIGDGDKSLLCCPSSKTYDKSHFDAEDANDKPPPVPPRNHRIDAEDANDKPPPVPPRKHRKQHHCKGFLVHRRHHQQYDNTLKNIAETSFGRETSDIAIALPYTKISQGKQMAIKSCSSTNSSSKLGFFSRLFKRNSTKNNETLASVAPVSSVPPSVPPRESAPFVLSTRETNFSEKLPHTSKKPKRGNELKEFKRKFARVKIRVHSEPPLVEEK